jgi:glutamine synthetase
LLSQRSPQRSDSYGLGKLHDMAPLFDEIYAGARAQGLPLRTLMSEYAPGQYEITLLHRNDALRAIDDAILFKRLIRATALRHGLIACFMAKPLADQAGSGMHVHVSVQDESGNNVRPARHRLVTSSIESAVPMRIRIWWPRPCWPAFHEGIAARLDPGPPVTGNGYEQGIATTLPRDWRSAIAAAENSSFLREALGESFLRGLIAIKTQEWDKFNASVPSIEYDWYLDNV